MVCLGGRTNKWRSTKCDLQARQTIHGFQGSDPPLLVGFIIIPDRVLERIESLKLNIWTVKYIKSWMFSYQTCCHGNQDDNLDGNCHELFIGASTNAPSQIGVEIRKLDDIGSVNIHTLKILPWQPLWLIWCHLQRTFQWCPSQLSSVKSTDLHFFSFFFLVLQRVINRGRVSVPGKTNQ